MEHVVDAAHIGVVARDVENGGSKLLVAMRIAVVRVPRLLYLHTPYHG